MGGIGHEINTSDNWKPTVAKFLYGKLQVYIFSLFFFQSFLTIVFNLIIFIMYW